MRNFKRNHYHSSLKDLVEKYNDPFLKDILYIIERQIDNGKFYPLRIINARKDISKRINQGKGPLSLKGIKLIRAEAEATKLHNMIEFKFKNDNKNYI